MWNAMHVAHAQTICKIFINKSIYSVRFAQQCHIILLLRPTREKKIYVEKNITRNLAHMKRSKFRTTRPQSTKSENKNIHTHTYGIRNHSRWKTPANSYMHTNAWEEKHIRKFVLIENKSKYGTQQMNAYNLSKTRNGEEWTLGKTYTHTHTHICIVRVLVQVIKASKIFVQSVSYTRSYYYTNAHCTNKMIFQWHVICRIASWQRHMCLYAFSRVWNHKLFTAVCCARMRQRASHHQQ